MIITFQEVCPPLLDVAFVLDTSGSIEEVYSEHIRWTVALTDALPISREAVRLSTIQYAGYPLTEFSLDTYNDKDDVVRHLQEMTFQSGVTRTGYALRRADDELFSEDRGARMNASKVIALFTDGLSIDDPLKPSELLRLRKGVKIYVVSVSADGFVPEMQRIAGDGSNVYGPEDLAQLKERLLQDVEDARICEHDRARTVTRSINDFEQSTATDLPIEIFTELLKTKYDPTTQASIQELEPRLHDNEHKRKMKMKTHRLHSAEVTPAPMSPTEIFERVLQSVAGSGGDSYLKNKHRKKKIRRIIRKKLKRIPGISKKEGSKTKVRRIIRKKVRKVISRVTSPMRKTTTPYQTSHNVHTTRITVAPPTAPPTLIPMDLFADEGFITPTIPMPSEFAKVSRTPTAMKELSSEPENARPPIIPFPHGEFSVNARQHGSKTFRPSAELHDGGVDAPKFPLMTFHKNPLTRRGIDRTSRLLLENDFRHGVEAPNTEDEASRALSAKTFRKVSRTPETTEETSLEKLPQHDTVTEPPRVSGARSFRKKTETSPPHEGFAEHPRILAARALQNQTKIPIPHEGDVESPRSSSSLKSTPHELPSPPAKDREDSSDRALSSKIFQDSARSVPSKEANVGSPRAFESKSSHGNGPPPARCPLDILFVVDSSGSVGEIYEKQKEFLFDLLLSIEPENQAHRVALIQFAGAKLQKTEWSFDTYRDNSQLLKAFSVVRHFTGTTYIGAALESAVQLLETRRPDVLTLVILISDGFSQDDAVRPAEVIRSMKNVEFYAVSLSKLSNRTYLHQMVKQEERMAMDNDTSSFGNSLKSRFYCRS
ncbi:hypothetical protein Q1695_001352 [Nippostrongylus brasiliensis]|nr:hypothetical protein Q1695_001352 [Nippostrongylus brasiliensis]